MTPEAALAAYVKLREAMRSPRAASPTVHGNSTSSISRGLFLPFGPSLDDHTTPYPQESWIEARKHAAPTSSGNVSAPTSVPPRPLAQDDRIVQVLEEMRVLLRYGHNAQVEVKIDEVLQQYPTDVALRRRVAQFYRENKMPDNARVVTESAVRLLLEQRGDGDPDQLREELE